MPDPHGLSRSLFMVTEPEGDRHALIETVRAGVRGGVTHVVLRRPGERASDLFQTAQELSRHVHEIATWKLLVHDRVDVALSACAQGAHLTLGSLPGRSAKRLLGTDRLMGISVHDQEEAIAARAQDADYVLFGHVYATPSHPGEAGRGLDALRAVARAVDIPVIAIGGITAERVDEVLAAGAAGVAVIGAISRDDDPEARADEIRAALDRAGNTHLSAMKEVP